MPRGRRPADYDAQIKALDEKIATHTRQIAALKAKRAELADKQQANAMKDLCAYMGEHDLSAGDIIARLSIPAASAKGDKSPA